MRESRQSFWVGLFVLVGLVALCALIVLFGRAGFWTRAADAYVLNVRFERAPGIRVGTLVTIGGIQVARVSDVRFVDRTRFDEGVNVEIAFEPGTELHQGTRAKTSEPGLGMGRPPIMIVPGPTDAPVLATGEPIPGEISSAVESLIPKAIVANFDRTATRFGEAAAALTPVLNDLHEVLQPRDLAVIDQPGGPPGNLASAVTRLDAGLKHFNDVLGDPEVKSRLRESVDNIYAMTQDGKVALTDFKAAASDIRTAAEKANTLVEKAAETVTHIDEHAEHVARSLTEDLEIASRFLTRLNSVIEKVDRGEGTIGRLFLDDRLYESLVLTFRRLAETTEEFRLLVKDWQKGKIRIGL